VVLYAVRSISLASALFAYLSAEAIFKPFIEAPPSNEALATLFCSEFFFLCSFKPQHNKIEATPKSPTKIARMIMMES